LKEKRYALIMLDMNFGRSAKNTGQEGFDWLARILEIDPSAVVVLITAYGDVELAVRAIKNGATDFVLKPWDNEKLLATLSSALRLKASRDENNQLKSKQLGRNLAAASDLPEMIFESRAMQLVWDTVQRVAETDANVLLLGENGTGKDLVAQAIHAQSSSSKENFVKVDMGAMTDRCSRASFLAMSKVRSRMPARTGPAASRLPMEVLSFWMRSEISRLARRPNSLRYCKTEPSHEWAPTVRVR
jgi:DNA-binding NtrC family response regulator